MAPPHVFFLLWLGQTLAFLGARVTSFAVGVALYQETGSVTRFTLIGLSIAIPTIVLSPLAGSLADRFPRRLVLLGATIGAIFGTVAVYALVRAGLLSAWTMYATIAVKAAASAFIWPTFTAATTLLVEKQHFARASGLNQTGQALGRIIGPLLGGALLVSVSLENIVLVEVGALVLATLLLAVLRLPEPKDLAARDAGDASEDAATPAAPGFGPGRAPAPVAPHRAGEGWAFLERHRGLFQILLLFAALNFCVGILQVLLAPLILAFASPLVLGIVSAVASCGMFVGGVAVSLWGGPGPGKRVQAILAITAIEGVLLVLGGAQADVTLIAVAAFFFLFGIPIIGGASQAIWQAKTPVELQGRVFAVRTMIAGGSIPLAMAVAGPLADFVFEPAMARGGALAASLGGWIGVGEGRGIGLLIVCLGAALVVSTAFAYRSAPLRRLETEIPDAIGDDSGEDERRAREAEKKGGPEPLLATGPLPALALGALLAAVALAAVVAQGPPAARDADAPATAFSAERALEHVRWIAREPHPTGSTANARVRDELVEVLEALGSGDRSGNRSLEVTIQRADVAVPSPVLPRLVTVENVVARLPGRVDAPADDPRATLLMAHYDSVIVSPGAADNGAAVAALVETARALLADEPLRHDVIFLFTDAEEYGLAGARAFLDHPWARDVAVMANFEARGHRGPVYMFETGAENGFWIPHFLDAAPRPIASSLMNQVYRRLPNDTDFTIFRDAGYAGFNFAFIGGLTHYHGGLDTPEALDLRSLQHHGETALALARRFADLDLDAAAPGPEDRRRADRVYFNVFGDATVHYPRWLAGLVSLLAAASVLAAIARGRRRGRLTTFGVGQGALAFLAAIVAIPALLVLAWYGVRDLGGVPVVMSSTFAAPFYMAAFAAVALGLFVLLMRLVRKLVAALDLAAGALLVSLLPLALTSGAYLPVESHFLLAWPILGAGLAFFWLVGRPSEIDSERTPGPWRTVGVLALGALPALLLLPPFVGPVYIGLQGLFELGGVPLVFEVLLLGLLLPQLEILGLRRGVTLWAVPLVVAAALLVPALAAPEPPEVDHVLYAVDHAVDLDNDPEAHWFSIDRPPAERLHGLGLGPKLDGSEAASITDFFPWARRPVPHAPAEVVPIATASAPEIVGTRSSEEGLEVDLELPSGAIARSLWIEPAGTVARVLWQGVEVTLGPAAPAGPGRVRAPILRQMPASAEPLTLVFPSLEEPDEVEIVIVDQYAGLPAGVAERPEDHAPRPSFEALSTDTSLVRHVLTLSRPGEE